MFLPKPDNLPIHIPPKVNPREAHKTTQKRVPQKVVSRKTTPHWRPHGLRQKIRHDHLLAFLQSPDGAGCYLVWCLRRILLVDLECNVGFADVFVIKAGRRYVTGEDGVEIHVLAVDFQFIPQAFMEIPHGGFSGRISVVSDARIECQSRTCEDQMPLCAFTAGILG